MDQFHGARELFSFEQNVKIILFRFFNEIDASKLDMYMALIIGQYPKLRLLFIKISKISHMQLSFHRKGHTLSPFTLHKMVW